MAFCMNASLFLILWRIHRYLRLRDVNKYRAGHMINSWVWKSSSAIADKHFSKQMLLYLQPKAQRRLLHPWPRERRRRLQHSTGKTARRHCPVYITPSWSVRSNASLKMYNCLCCLRQEIWLEAELIFLCLQERTRMRSWTSWCTRRGGSIETVSCWETACRASAGMVSLHFIWAFIQTIKSVEALVTRTEG